MTFGLFFHLQGHFLMFTVNRHNRCDVVSIFYFLLVDINKKIYIRYISFIEICIMWEYPFETENEREEGKETLNSIC